MQGNVVSLLLRPLSQNQQRKIYSVSSEKHIHVLAVTRFKPHVMGLVIKCVKFVYKQFTAVYNMKITVKVEFKYHDTTAICSMLC